MLRLRHAIVGTNYYVEIFAVGQRREVQRRMRPTPAGVGDGGSKTEQKSLLWSPISQLHRLPLTGLARKVLQRTALMRTDITHPENSTVDGAASSLVSADEAEAQQQVPLLIGRHTRATDGSEG